MLGFTVLFFALINSSYCGKSLTIVLDSTFSMKEELSVIKANIRALNIENESFEDYILVTFKETNVEPPYIYNNPKDLVTQLNTVTTGARTHVCPENSLAAIENALRFSKDESLIFVFTDAYAQDYDKVGSIKNLCRDKHNQIIIFLSGYCWPSVNTETGNIEVYDEIAKSCSGVFLQFNNTNELRQVFRFMKEIMKTAWTDITPHEKFNNFQQFTVTLDFFTTDFIIVSEGKYPEIDVINNYQSQQMEKILDTKHALVTRLVKTEPGTYTVKVRGHGSNSVTVYERSQISFEFGFSTRNPNELRETASRPIAGFTNYILIKIDYTTIKLTEIEWLTYKENVKTVLYLEQKRPGLYVTSIFVESGKSFKFWIKGRNSDTYQDIKGSTKTLFPQVTDANPTRTIPQAEIFEPERNMIDFGNNITLICKVKGYPKPNITWENENNIVLPSEDFLLETPNVFLSYMTLSNASKNTTVYCKCGNYEGTDSQSLDIYVNRTFTFDVIQRPKDTKVEYGDELKMYCQVDAYPEATITWYLNSTKLETAYIDDNAIVIDSVGLEDNGVYDCDVSNGVESKRFSAVVNVTGIEAPEIDKEDTDISLKPRDSKELDCSLNKGKPAPEITWKYKSLEAFEFGDNLPSGIEEEDEVLRIGSAEKKHGGTYRCTARNIIGEDTKDIIVRIQHAPIIKNSQHENLNVRKDEVVKLECEVESSPNAEVRWEMSQDDVIINFDEHYKIDKSNALSFVARWNDSGSYHCIAENNVGRADKSVFLNVLVPPFIEAPISELINARIGSNVTLPCNVLYGNPAPSTRWEFKATNSAPRVILRANSNNTLHLINISRLQEGTYMCVVENDIDNDRIIYQLKVHV